MAIWQGDWNGEWKMENAAVLGLEKECRRLDVAKEPGEKRDHCPQSSHLMVTCGCLAALGYQLNAELAKDLEHLEKWGIVSKYHLTGCHRKPCRNRKLYLIKSLESFKVHKYL